LLTVAFNDKTNEFGSFCSCWYMPKWWWQWQGRISGGYGINTPKCSPSKYSQYFSTSDCQHRHEIVNFLFTRSFLWHPESAVETFAIRAVPRTPAGSLRFSSDLSPGERTSSNALGVSLLVPSALRFNESPSEKKFCLNFCLRPCAAWRCRISNG